MAYNPYKEINENVRLKGLWNEANAQGDEKKKRDIADAAEKVRRTLRDNGYGDIASELKAADYSTAEKIRNKWGKIGKTPTRDYLYTLGNKYGMSQGEVDKIISWDNDTGQVSIGGKVVGTPDSVIDGVSYWGDTSILDNAFNDYVNRSGITRSKSAAVNQENESLFKKYNQEYEDLKNTNPFTTEEAKAILAKYDLAGLQGRDNVVASGSAANGGNIDSYAAANAMRQQASLVNQGQMAVLDAHQQKLDHARALLSDMGVNIDRVFNQDQTEKLNDTSIKATISDVTGVQPDEWVVSNNPYMNDDGTIKDEFKDTDFSAIMAKAKENGNTDAYNYAATARYYKIMGDYGKWGKYDDGNYIAPGSKLTETVRQFDETMKYNRDLIASEEKMNADNNKTTLAQSYAKSQENTYNMTYNQAEEAIKNGVLSDGALAIYNAYNRSQYSKTNPPPIYNANKTKKEDSDTWAGDEGPD